jgi:hypothetical protein
VVRRRDHDTPERARPRQGRRARFGLRGPTSWTSRANPKRSTRWTLSSKKPTTPHIRPCVIHSTRSLNKSAPADAEVGFWRLVVTHPAGTSHNIKGLVIGSTLVAFVCSSKIGETRGVVRHHSIARRCWWACIITGQRLS